MTQKEPEIVREALYQFKDEPFTAEALDKYEAIINKLHEKDYMTREEVEKEISEWLACYMDAEQAMKNLKAGTLPFRANELASFLTRLPKLNYGKRRT
jgi:hypothetical protein